MNSRNVQANFPIWFKILVTFHIVLNLFLYFYLNRDNPLISNLPILLKDFSLATTYRSIVLSSLQSHGLAFFLALHFSILSISTTILFISILYISAFTKIKRRLPIFAAASGLLYSFIYFIIVYNAINIHYSGAKLSRWNIKYFFNIISCIARAANINLYILYSTIILFICLLMLFHYSGLKNIKIYAEYHNPIQTNSAVKSFFKHPAGWITVCFLFLNFIWFDPNTLAIDQLLLSWTQDEGVSCFNLTQQTQAIDDFKEFDKEPNNPDPRLPNIILIIVDSLRADHLGFNGYQRSTTPFLDSLSATGKIEKADFSMSTCSETFCGISSTLLSKPYQNIFKNTVNLPALLQSVGYKLMFYSSDIPDYKGLYNLYSRNPNNLYNANTTKNHPPLDDNIILEGLKLIKKFNGRQCFFLFHIMSAHALGINFNMFNDYQPTGRILNKFKLSKDDTIIKKAINSYDNGVRQADHVIQNIYNRLEENGYLNNSILVILGDHGEGLGEHGYFLHANFLYNEFTNIPILFIRTNKKKNLFLDYATQIDIAPTIASLIDVKIPHQWEGEDLTTSHEARKTFHEAIPAKDTSAILEKESDMLYKYIKSKEECVRYNLKVDPREEKPIATPCARFDR